MRPMSRHAQTKLTQNVLVAELISVDVVPSAYGPPDRAAESGTISDQDGCALDARRAV